MACRPSSLAGTPSHIHGYRRATEDVDVVWRRLRAAEESLATALAELDARCIGREIDPATGIERTYPATPPYVRATRLMMLWTRHGFLDVFDHVPGLPDADVGSLFDTSIVVGDLRFASLDWLRRMKRASGRPKDLIDLEQLPEPPADP